MKTAARWLLLTVLLIGSAACSNEEPPVPVEAYEEVDIETFQDLIGEPHACALADWTFDGRCGDFYCFSEASWLDLLPQNRIMQALFPPTRLKVHQSKIALSETYLKRIGGKITELGEAQHMFCNHLYRLLDAEGRPRPPRLK